MLASISVESPKAKNDSSGTIMYCCATLTAPSSMTAHMQTGDILVSINGVSLISSSNEAELIGGADAFFNVITSAIKHAKSPRKVRLLRPMRLKSPSNGIKSAVCEISLTEIEASLLFDTNFKTHIPKFTVGKVPVGRIFEPVTASLFDVIFPFQKSLGIRIFPYKLISQSSHARKALNSPPKRRRGALENNLMDDMLEDDSIEEITDIYEDYGDETKEGDNESMESEMIASFNQSLDELHFEEILQLNLKTKNDDVRVIDNATDNDNKENDGGIRISPTLRLFHAADEDIVSDRGRIGVESQIYRLESDGDDFIPVSSPTPAVGGLIGTMYDEEEYEEIVVMSPKSTKAVGDMVAIFESSSKSNSSKDTPRYSPIRRVIVTLDDCSPIGSVSNSPDSSDIDKSVLPTLPTSPTSPSVLDLVAALRSAATGRERILASENILLSNPMRRSFEVKKSDHMCTETLGLKRPFERSISPIGFDIFPESPPKASKNDLKNDLIPPDTPDKLNDSTTQRIVTKAVAKIQTNLKSVTSENEQLKAKMDFYKRRVSIEQQLLNFELKGVKAKLQSSESALEDTKIESKMNAIILQDELEQNMTGVVSTILSEKEDLELELKKTKNDFSVMEIKLNNELTAKIEENETIRSELEVRIEENTALTADILNLQAERDCLKASNAMTEYRTKTQSKIHIKEIERLKETEKKTKSKVLSFIADFDSTISPTANYEETIESFLNGRGLAINKKRRKVFAALQADNMRLYDDLDVMQELLEVEAALHKTRVELYSKSMNENKNDAPSTDNIEHENGPTHTSPEGDNPRKKMTPNVNILLNNVFKEEVPASRPVNEEKHRRTSRSSIEKKKTANAATKTAKIENSKQNTKVLEESRNVPGSTHEGSSRDFLYESPDGKTSIEGSENSKDGNKNNENRTLGLDTPSGVNSIGTSPNSSPALSSSSLLSASTSSKGMSRPSPTILSMTPRKKSIVSTPKSETVLKNEYKSPGSKVPVGFGSNASRSGGLLKGGNGAGSGNKRHSPIVTISNANSSYLNDNIVL